MAKKMHSCVTLLLILKPTGYVIIIRERKGTRTESLKKRSGYLSEGYKFG